MIAACVLSTENPTMRKTVRCDLPWIRLKIYTLGAGLNRNTIAATTRMPFLLLRRNTRTKQTRSLLVFVPIVLPIRLCVRHSSVDTQRIPLTTRMSIFIRRHKQRTWLSSVEQAMYYLTKFARLSRTGGIIASAHTTTTRFLAFSRLEVIESLDRLL